MRDFARAPPIDANKQEQPNHVHEMPIPSGRFKAEMAFRCEMPLDRADQADKQEGGADNHMEAMEAGGQEEGRRINATAREWERRHAVFPSLQTGEDQAQQHGDGQAIDLSLIHI